MVTRATSDIGDLPIPPKPDKFTPFGAPDGFTPNYSAFKWHDGTLWYPNRPIIRPRVIVVHTNAASREGSTQSQIDWGNSGVQSRTHPHYMLNEPTPSKTVPTDRRGIGNSSTTNWELQHGTVDCSFWSLVIETADEGWPDPGHAGGFLTESRYDQDMRLPHAELLARAIAYECVLWDIPPIIPTEYGAPGIVSHTDPWGYPAFTIRRGKVCPGDRKKLEVREHVIPRAADIVAAWTADPGEPPDGGGIIKPPIEPPEPLPEDQMSKPTHLINYKGIGVFHPDTLMIVSGATYAYYTRPEADGGLGVPVIEDDHDETFLGIIEANGPAAAAKLGFRACKNGVDLPGIEDPNDG